MGSLIYDSTLTIDFDDRVLAHLQIVIGSKLRRGESFFFGWRDDSRIGDGRTAIWLHPGIPLAFKYFGGRPPSINRQWVELLSQSANTANGLQLIPEPPEQSAERK